MLVASSTRGYSLSVMSAVFTTVVLVVVPPISRELRVVTNIRDNKIASNTDIPATPNSCVVCVCVCGCNLTLGIPR